MKLTFSLAVIAGTTSFCLPVLAQVAGNPPATVQRQRNITPPKGNLTADEYAIALAKSADENIIMDATDVPADTRIPAYPSTVPKDWAPVFYSVLEDFRGNVGVTVDKIGNTTILRHAPDALSFARAIITSGALQSKEPPEDLNQLDKDLYEYAQKNNAWKDDEPRQTLNIKIADLPQALRERVLRWGRQQLLVGAADYSLWLSDDFWNKGTGLIRPGKMSASPAYPQVVPQFEVASSTEGQAPQFYEITYYDLKPSDLNGAYIAKLYKR